MLTLEADRLGAGVGDQVKFTARLEPPDTSARYRFNFGDGTKPTTGSVNVVHHRYSRAGVFHPTVVAQTGNQRVPSEGEDLTIYSLTLVADPSSAGVGDQVKFTARLTPRLQPEDEQAQYTFDFGDGKRIADSDKEVAYHSYSRADIFHPIVVAELSSEAIPPMSVKASIEPTGLKIIPLSLASSAPKGTGTPEHRLTSAADRLNADVGDQLKFAGKGAPEPPQKKRRLIWVLVLVIVLMIIAAWRRIRHLRSSRLRAISHPDAGIHEMAQIEQNGPYLSLTLQAGMDSGEDRITFGEKAAAE